MIATTAKRIAGNLADTRTFGRILRRLEERTSSTQALRVLAYHRIDYAENQPDCYPGLISASPETFAAQMQFIANHYHVATMDEVISATRNGVTLPEKTVQLTFDDATCDFQTYAWPILKQLGLPATVFVPTAFPDNPALQFWWDRLYNAVMRSDPGTTIPVGNAIVQLVNHRQRSENFRYLKEFLKRLPHTQFVTTLDAITAAANVRKPAANNVLGWDALRQLRQEGLTLAPHTHTHPMLNQLPEETIHEEIVSSWDLLERQTNSDVPKALAYPAGGVNDKVTSVLENAKFDLAYTTERGVNRNLKQRFRLKRINVGARTTLGLLRLQLANWGK
jgi:peptidoglycan/xylan/chitin deacetylase (PgdA/CDA1 family)